MGAEGPGDARGHVARIHCRDTRPRERKELRHLLRLQRPGTGRVAQAIHHRLRESDEKRHRSTPEQLSRHGVQSAGRALRHKERRRTLPYRQGESHRNTRRTDGSHPNDKPAERSLRPQERQDVLGGNGFIVGLLIFGTHRGEHRDRNRNRGWFVRRQRGIHRTLYSGARG